jgi:tRNA(Ile2) C34 agmatinyltransferase TiaS
MTIKNYHCELNRFYNHSNYYCHRCGGRMRKNGKSYKSAQIYKCVSVTCKAKRTVDETRAAPSISVLSALMGW